MKATVATNGDIGANGAMAMVPFEPLVGNGCRTNGHATVTWAGAMIEHSHRLYQWRTGNASDWPTGRSMGTGYSSSSSTVLELKSAVTIRAER